MVSSPILKTSVLSSSLPLKINMLHFAALGINPHSLQYLDRMSSSFCSPSGVRAFTYRSSAHNRCDSIILLSSGKSSTSSGSCCVDSRECIARCKVSCCVDSRECIARCKVSCCVDSRECIARCKVSCCVDSRECIARCKVSCCVDSRECIARCKVLCCVDSRECIARCKVDHVV